MDTFQKKILTAEKEIERLKFVYEINKSFLIPIFNANITRQLAFFGFAITMLQIDKIQENFYLVIAVAAIFSVLI